jgi:hypothetical protein
MTTFQLDRTLVDRLVAGTVDPAGEAALAEQVARILPFHWTLPNPIEAALSRIIAHLGGQPALLAWLDRHPGLPRLVARLHVLIGLLERLSDEPAILTALRELRAETPYPQGLAGYLTPGTDSATLASLAGEIESLLKADRTEEAGRLSLAVVAMLRQVAPRAGELDPALGDLADLLEQVRQDIVAARPIRQPR